MRDERWNCQTFVVNVRKVGVGCEAAGAQWRAQGRFYDSIVLLYWCISHVGILGCLVLVLVQRGKDEHFRNTDELTCNKRFVISNVGLCGSQTTL